MANHSSSMNSYKLDNNESTFVSMNNFKLTKEMMLELITSMGRLKPCGVNKHINMLLLREKLSKKFNLDIPTKCIWDYLNTKWNIEAADIIEGTHFNTDEKNFALPEEFDQLIAEEGEKIRKVQIKEDLEIENRSEEALNTKRSLLHKIKPEEKEQDCLLNKKKPNKSIDLEKCEKVPGVRGRKKKLCNVTESRFSYDNIKQTNSYKVDLTVSNGLSKSLPLENVKGKTSDIYGTPETISRKSNLRSSDINLKFKSALDKICVKDGHDLISLTNRVEGLKPEKQFCSLMIPKFKHSMKNKNEAVHKIKEKSQRVTSDQLVILQSLLERPSGRRSCNKKSL